MLRYTSSLEHYPGYIDLPERFTGAMFNDYRQIIDSIGKQKPNISVQRLNAYAIVDFVGGINGQAGHGVWGIESIATEHIEAWFKDPDKEDFQFISWLYKVMQEYITRNTNPFLSRPKSTNSEKE